MAKKELTIKELFATPELLEALQSLAGVKEGDLAAWLRKIAFGHLSIEDQAAVLTGNRPIDLERLKLFGAIQSPGDKLRPLGEMGYLLTKENVGGKQRSDVNSIWRITKIEQQKDADPTIPPRARALFKSIKKCVLTFDKIDERTMQIDHRTPVMVSGGYDHGKNPSDAVIEALYMPVGNSGNTWKREACIKCQRTKIRPGGGREGFPHWSEGDATFDKELKCNGCFFHNPVAWRESLHKKIIPIAAT